MAIIFNPCHPGRVLKDYLGEMTVTEAAKRLGASRANLSNILNQKAGISAAMSLRLSAALRTSPGFWFKMQNQYEMSLAMKNKQPKTKPFPRETSHQVSA